VGRVLAGVAAALLVVGGVVAVLAIFTARDDAPVSDVSGPGELQADKGNRHLPAGEHVPSTGLTDPPTSGPHHVRLVMRDRRVLSPDEILHALELGDVILFYSAARPPAPLRTVQRDVSGPFDAEVAAAGQQVILARLPGSGPVTAAAWRRLLRVDDPADPRVREFAEAWLGRGTPR
jgi:Protein of unknown function (DUF3105)